MADPPAQSPRHPSEAIPFLVALAVLSGFLALMGALLFYEIPPSNKDVELTLAGVLATAFGGVVGYYFGSSVSSKTKDATIETLATAPAFPTPPTTPEAKP